MKENKLLNVKSLKKMGLCYNRGNYVLFQNKSTKVFATNVL